jgi:hypothetical protein
MPIEIEINRHFSKGLTVFSGTLDWAGYKHQLTVRSLIPRNDWQEVVVEIQTPWEDAGDVYKLEAVAKIDPSGHYSTPLIACVNCAGQESYETTKLVLTIVRHSDNFIGVDGIWKELAGGVLQDIGPFAGYLSRAEPKEPKALHPFPNRPPEPLKRSDRHL